MEWPTQLPPMNIGSMYEPVDPQIRTNMQSGRTFVRRNFTGVPENFKATWIFNDEQAAIFEDFYWNVTDAGTKWFNMPVILPQTKITRQVQFQGPFTRRQMNGGTGCNNWEYSADMQHFLRYGVNDNPDD